MNILSSVQGHFSLRGLGRKPTTRARCQVQKPHAGQGTSRRRHRPEPRRLWSQQKRPGQVTWARCGPAELCDLLRELQRGRKSVCSQLCIVPEVRRHYSRRSGPDPRVKRWFLFHEHMSQGLRCPEQRGRQDFKHAFPKRAALNQHSQSA